MPKSCAFALCINNKESCPHLSFYLIPNETTEPDRRINWLQLIRRDGGKDRLWNPRSDYHYVCSNHFITGYLLSRHIDTIFTSLVYCY